ncbi:cell adhesion molecule 4 isoform X23 [Carassius gibelio]|uniref:cell adhesion molecule 4 isoform X23 n=1 Tax=Carassius gibelio TaxID=101364 RepID=UPI002278434A|nr:cell adhesion molecule 4 isoform X23 [Carassius gibelio]
MSCLTDARKRRHIYIFAQLDPAFVWSTVHSNTYNMFQRFYGLSTVLLFVTLTGAQAECPVQLNPQRVVVRYNGSVAVNCSTSVPHKGMGWEASEGAVPKTSNSLITWRVSHLTEWEIKPFCFINYEGQCVVELPVIIYKTPDNVSISIVKRTGPMIEGEQYQLQCDVHDVAPVQNLTVKWYKGQTLLNQTTFTEDSKTPVNETVTLLIRPDRDDDGAQYWCEAKLDLGAEGPQYSTNKTSAHLNVELHYKPKHSNSTETIIQKDVVTLNCTVKANPAPVYKWYSDHLKEEISSSVLQSSTLSPGNYTCTATNYLGTDTKVFIIEAEQRDRTTFWVIVICGVALVVVLIVAYVIYKKRSSSNSII